MRLFNKTQTAAIALLTTMAFATSAAAAPNLVPGM